ncbi:MAG: hypothetical protein ACD_78C00298G0001 [uncultured bacterium (gcode 4)]|uniref:Uncharacterized protein n=1 Tax=uncultured bacterium (gcode 4) TaxID=1234023 RepID=K1XXR8_9BACT|nr:MAG: hypothetical protein ACD_78C00298G0001 [uncultured bacterium (gcode 4)]
MNNITNFRESGYIHFKWINEILRETFHINGVEVLFNHGTLFLSFWLTKEYKRNLNVDFFCCRNNKEIDMEEVSTHREFLYFVYEDIMFLAIDSKLDDMSVSTFAEQFQKFWIINTDCLGIKFMSVGNSGDFFVGSDIWDFLINIT